MFTVSTRGGGITIPPGRTTGLRFTGITSSVVLSSWFSVLSLDALSFCLLFSALVEASLSFAAALSVLVCKSDCWFNVSASLVLVQFSAFVFSVSFCPCLNGHFLVRLALSVQFWLDSFSFWASSFKSLCLEFVLSLFWLLLATFSWLFWPNSTSISWLKSWLLFWLLVPFSVLVAQVPFAICSAIFRSISFCFSSSSSARR